MYKTGCSSFELLVKALSSRNKRKKCGIFDLYIQVCDIASIADVGDDRYGVGESDVSG